MVERHFRQYRPVRAVAMFSLFAAGMGGGVIAKADESQAAKASAPRPPEGIYARTCGYCHGYNVGPVIRGRGLPAQAIASMVRHGQGAMPAFRPTEISDAELRTLSAWISASKADPKEHGQ